MLRHLISRLVGFTAVIGALIGLAPGPSATAAAAGASPVAVTPFQTTTQVVGAGEFTKIYDPSTGEPGPWYINDHTFVRGPDGTWHMFGITHAEPADPEHEVSLAHATAPTLHGPWTKRPFALTVDPAFGETHLWAPYVMRSRGLYYMFYAGGGPDHTRSEISVATSRDLWHWTRYGGDPLFRDGYDARDPYVLRVGDRWVLYYDATSDPAGGHHVVAYRTSTDLLHWGPRRIAFTDPSTGTGGGPTESPFVVRHDGRYYLFLGPRGGYIGTDVFTSRDPLRFDPSAKAGHIAAHAAEVVRDTDGQWYVSGAGWGQGGLWLAPLYWNEQVTTRGFDVSAPTYRARITTQPHAQLTSLQAPVAGQWREVLSTAFRGTEPYAGVGGFGASDEPGPAARSSFDPGTGVLELDGMPLGRQPVTADWRFTFSPDWFDTSLTWHVTGPTTAPVHEVALSLDTALPRLGDDTGTGRSGDVPGFPRWTMADDGSVSLVAAYRAGSAWSEQNRWYDPADGTISWQPLWSPGGVAWPTGDHPGGTWRIGVSPKGADTAFADRLWAGVNS